MVSQAKFTAQFSDATVRGLQHLTTNVLKAKLRDEEQNLEAAEKIFERFSTATTDEKMNFVSELNRIYSHIQLFSQINEELPLSIQQTAARVFFLYGRVMKQLGYHDAAQPLLHLSLETQLVGLQSTRFIPAENSSQRVQYVDSPSLKLIRESGSLQDLEGKLWKKNPDFTNIMELLDKGIDPSIMASKQRSLMLGRTLHWLAFSSQQIQELRGRDNLPCFEKIYNLAKNVLGRFPTADCKREISAIILSSELFMARLRDPENHKDHVVALGRVIIRPEIDDGSIFGAELEAQFYNELGLMLAEQGKYFSAYVEIKQALDTANSTEGFDPHLKAVILNNLVIAGFRSIQAKENKVTAEEVLTHSDKLVDLINELGFNHPNHEEFFKSTIAIQNSFTPAEIVEATAALQQQRALQQQQANVVEDEEKAEPQQMDPAALAEAYKQAQEGVKAVVDTVSDCFIS